MGLQIYELSQPILGFLTPTMEDLGVAYSLYGLPALQSTAINDGQTLMSESEK